MQPLGIARELKHLNLWADSLPKRSLPRRYTRTLWSDDLTRSSLRAIGLQPPMPVSARVVPPAALLLSLALPAEALTIQAIDARNGRPIPGVRVQTNGKVVGTTNSQGKVEVDSVSKRVQLTREGYQPLEVPADQLLDQNLLVLTPNATPPAAKPTMRPTAKPTNKPVAKPTVRPTEKPTPKPTVHPTMKPIVKPTIKPAAQATKAPRPAEHERQVRPTGNRYTVQRGDSLYLIAWKVLGDPNRWPEIHALNRDQIENPHRIQIGMVLNLPGNAPVSYRIRPGDTLWDLAERFLGSGTRWDEIYRLNRSTIRSPRLLMPDQEILLPAKR